MRRKILVGTILFLMALVISGCDSPGAQDASTAPQTGAESRDNLPSKSNNKQPVEETMQITTYQATKDALHITPEIHVVPKNIHPAQTALELLATASNQSKLISVVPPGTKILGVSVKNHIAYANFNEQLIKNHSGGSTGEILLVAAIVDTLTEFPEIQQVQILVNGKKVNTIAGHMDISEPLSRSEEIIKK